MGSTRILSDISAQMAIMNEEDFRNFSLRFLHFWDIDIKPYHLHGINYAVIRDKKRDITVFSYAVSCMYFENKILGQSEASQAIRLIDSLSQLGIRVEQYIMFHNQQHGNGEERFNFLDPVREKLLDLRNSGSINNFFLLDRKDFIKKSQEKFKIIINDLLKQKSGLVRENIRQRINRIQNIFEFGKYYINNVPFIESEININSIGRPDIVKKNKSTDEDIISKQVWNLNAKERWALVHGEAGIGKTTTALNLILTKDLIPFFINCSEFDLGSLTSGSNLLLERSIREINLLENIFQEPELEFAYKLSGSTLSELLENSKDHLIVVDGIDENRYFSDRKLKGFRNLSNQLSGFHIPVFIFMRTSHYNYSLDEFDSPLGEITKSGRGARNKARVFELKNWGKSNIINLVNSAIQEEEDVTSKNRLNAFLEVVISDDYKQYYQEMPNNPLFLQMIMEDVAINGIRFSKRVLLIHKWITYKIRRDIVVGERLFVTEKDNVNFDLNKEVNKILYLMELVSTEMLNTSSSVELEPFVEYSIVEKHAYFIFKKSLSSYLEITLNSLLISSADTSEFNYQGTKNRISFMFRIFQEYFLACSLIRKGCDFSAYPVPVKEFCKEIGDSLIAADSENSELACYIKGLNVYLTQEEKNTHFTQTTPSMKLFFSYAHEDETLRDELAKHLSLLKRQNIITDWHDRNITAGTEWAQAIDENLNTANIILLLISSDFLASDYCYDKEMTRALERHSQGTARVIPIILRPCDLHSAPFGKLQALPIEHGGGAKPVTKWDDQDEAFTNIAQGIRKAVAELQQGKSSPATMQTL